LANRPSHATQQKILASPEEWAVAQTSEDERSEFERTAEKVAGLQRQLRDISAAQSRVAAKAFQTGDIIDNRWDEQFKATLLGIREKLDATLTGEEAP
jgi:uncharacterized protein YijF (DUF1287 family)